MTTKPKTKIDLAALRRAGFFEPPTLSAHEQMRCKAFVAAIEKVEREFGMRLPINERLLIRMKYDGDFERRVDEKGRVYAHDNEPWKMFRNVEIGKTWDEHVKELEARS